MPKIFFTPGPSQLYPTVRKHIQVAIEENIPSISHRGEKFHEIFQNTQASLRELLKIPKTHKIFFLSSGTEAMERIIENTVDKYSLHFVNGSFSKRFYQTAVELQKKPMKVEAPFGSGFTFDRIKIPNETELICFTQNETSNGVALDPLDIYKFKKVYSDKLTAVDTVSSAPIPEINFKFVDLNFFSVQKGFGLPAGLAVLIVSPQAIEKSLNLIKRGKMTGSFHSFSSLISYLDKSETPETPNVLGIYLLGCVCRDFINYGIKKVRRETEIKAGLLYDFFAKNKLGKPFVTNQSDRSKTVIVIETRDDSQILISKLKEKGLIIGSGYKDYKNKHLRIANFPAHSISSFKQLLHHLGNFAA